MSIIEESGGRLNAFAKEPKIQVLSKEASDSKQSQIFLILGILIFIGLIGVAVTIS